MERCLNFLWIFSIVKKKIGGGGGGGCGFFFLEKQFFLISRFVLFSTLKKYWKKKCPFTYWLNGRWFLQIVERDSWNLYPSSIPLFWFCILNVWVVWGGGGNVFLTFYAISNISRKKIWEYKPIISHLMFSSCFFCMLEILKSAPSLTATDRYWLNGRFLQIVDIWHFIMRLEILKSVPSLTG